MSIKINKLSEHIKEKDFKELCDQIYYLTDHLSIDYPRHKEWFYNTHMKGLGVDREVVYITYHRNICGVAFLKCTEKEKKICTFYVAEYSRNHGIGNELLKECFKYLKTTKPLISIPKYKVRYFLYYVYKYDWKITQILQEYYNKENDEVVFNGKLS